MLKGKNLENHVNAEAISISDMEGVTRMYHKIYMNKASFQSVSTITETKFTFFRPCQY
jgi:hypothetical protein